MGPEHSCFCASPTFLMELPRWLGGKEYTCSVGDEGSIPGLGVYHGKGNGNLLQYSCLGNPMDRGAWQATVHRIADESDMI